MDLLNSMLEFFSAVNISFMINIETMHLDSHFMETGEKLKIHKCPDKLVMLWAPLKYSQKLVVVRPVEGHLVLNCGISLQDYQLGLG